MGMGMGMGWSLRREEGVGGYCRYLLMESSSGDMELRQDGGWRNRVEGREMMDGRRVGEWEYRSSENERCTVHHKEMSWCCACAVSVVSPPSCAVLT